MTVPQQSLATMPARELAAVGIPDGWINRVGGYEIAVRDRLLAEWGADVSEWEPRAAALNRENLRGRGETTFIVERVGWLTYRIAESRGELRHTAETPLVAAIEFRSEFYLRPTQFDLIRGSLRDFLGAPLLLRPSFNQVVMVPRRPSQEIVFDHTGGRGRGRPPA